MVISDEETVAVVDPRHPLFGGRFRLVAIQPWRRTEQYCVIWLQPDGVERLIPLSVTDRAPTPPAIFPSAVNLTGLERLVKLFEQVTHGRNLPAEVPADEPAQPCALSSDLDPNPVRECLAHPQRHTARPRSPVAGQPVLADGPTTERPSDHHHPNAAGVTLPGGEP